MNLIDGLILHTIDQVNHVSQHSMLMKFYKIRIEIDAAYDEDYKKAFHSFPVYCMEIEARAILKALDIM